MKKIAIIGCGISGMTLAKRLRSAGYEVGIFEKESEPGGIARGFKAEGWQDSVEYFYHHWFQKDNDLLNLIGELGLKDHIVFRTPKTVMYHKRKFYPFDTIPAAIAYPGLGYGIHKLRFGLAGVYLRLTKNWRDLEKVTAKEWMTRYAGEFAYKTMWEPMMIGKFGSEYADKVNMAWLWARIYSRTTSLGTFDGGMQKLYDIFAGQLKDAGVELHFGTDIRKVQTKADGTFRLSGKNSEWEDFDKVIVTTSPGSMLDLCEELPRDYREQLASLKHLGAVVLCVRLKKPLSPQGYYWYNLPKSEGYPFLALVEHTNFVPRERYNNETVIYAGDYLPRGHEYFSLSAEELLEKLIPGFKKINPEFSEDWIIGTSKFAADYAQPVPFVDHSKAIPAMKTPVEGLYFISMSQIYPWDRGMNFAVRWANGLAETIISGS
ncbi:MAG: NAD(P)/FAD-dependent oxidoreductase [Anaerolineaceae bacterium]|nr:NAD(P)/FAD-dependent oxidoreductase [Anaerolineaceae bacterium]